MKLSELVLDFDIYPRHSVDGANVRGLIASIEAGETLPPIIVDAKTRRVVDGFHRVKAYQRTLDPDAEISVETREYDSEEDLLLDAIRLNSGHGQRLTPYDRARSIHLADERGIDSEQIANALRVTVDQVENVRVTKMAKAGQQVVPIKATVRHLAGRSLSKKQQEGNRKAGGMRALFYVRQVENLVDNDLIDGKDEKLLVALADLHKKLEKWARLAKA